MVKKVKSFFWVACLAIACGAEEQPQPVSEKKLSPKSEIVGSPSKNIDQGSLNIDQGSCISCSSAEPNICGEEQKVLKCNADGTSTFVKQCTGDTRCVKGQCQAFQALCPDRVEFDGSSQVVEVFEPVPVSECYIGGDIGRDLKYQEDHPEIEKRSLSFYLPGCNSIWSLGINFSQVFGLDFKPVSSETLSSLSIISGYLPPQMKGQFFRQKIKLHKTALLYKGQTLVGTATLTDWTFTARLAVGKTCPAKTNLPGAKKFPASMCQKSE